MILLDTHVLLWLAVDEAKLSRPARSAINAARREEGLGLSCISLVELAIAIRRGRATIPVPADAFLNEIYEYARVLPISVEVALRAAEFAAPYPRDPMDRIIGATALVHGMRLVTADERIRHAKVVPTVW